MLASSSHMKGVSDLGCDLQNFGQCLTRKGPAERLVNVIKRHTASQALENEGDCEPGAANCQLPAKKLGIHLYCLYAVGCQLSIEFTLLPIVEQLAAGEEKRKRGLGSRRRGLASTLH